jgi:methyl-accepting chemotaxis protein
LYWISQIDAATRELSKRSSQLLADAGSVQTVAESNASRTAELDQVAEVLARLTKSLEEDVGAFKL